MRKLIITASMLSLVGFLLIPGGFAQTETTPGTSREPTVDRPSEITPSTPKALYTSDLIGATVKNLEGESLGSIQELVLDPQDAKIKNVIVSMGGLLGIGAKAVAIPWQEVTPQSDGKAVLVAMGKEELQSAPEWKKPVEETRLPGREPATEPMAPRQGALGR